jgi:hypothetical protein
MFRYDRTHHTPRVFLNCLVSSSTFQVDFHELASTTGGDTRSAEARIDYASTPKPLPVQKLSLPTPPATPSAPTDKKKEELGCEPERNFIQGLAKAKQGSNLFLEWGRASQESGDEVDIGVRDPLVVPEPNDDREKGKADDFLQNLSLTSHASEEWTASQRLHLGVKDDEAQASAVDAVSTSAKVEHSVDAAITSAKVEHGVAGGMLPPPPGTPQGSEHIHGMVGSEQQSRHGVSSSFLPTPPSTPAKTDVDLQPPEQTSSSPSPISSPPPPPPPPRLAHAPPPPPPSRSPVAPAALRSVMSYPATAASNSSSATAAAATAPTPAKSRVDAPDSGGVGAEARPPGRTQNVAEQLHLEAMSNHSSKFLGPSKNPARSGSNDTEAGGAASGAMPSDQQRVGMLSIVRLSLRIGFLSLRPPAPVWSVMLRNEIKSYLGSLRGMRECHVEIGRVEAGEGVDEEEGGSMEGGGVGTSVTVVLRAEDGDTASRIASFIAHKVNSGGGGSPSFTQRLGWGAEACLCPVSSVMSNRYEINRARIRTTERVPSIIP